MTATGLLTRVVLRNYKSIATCDVRLGPLTYLVGANGSGKSNFLDALHLVRDALTSSVDNALNERGGLSEVRRRSSSHPTHFGMRLELRLRNGRSGHYAFNVGALAGGGYEVQTEECALDLLLAADKCGDEGWILVLLHADDDCPVDLGPHVLKRAREVVPHRSVSVVLAKREYEAWFLAAADSLHGQRGLVLAHRPTFDPESQRDAKGWLGAQLTDGRYRETTTDQPAFSALMDLEMAREASRSFRKLCDEWSRQIAGTG